MEMDSCEALLITLLLTLFVGGVHNEEETNHVPNVPHQKYHTMREGMEFLVLGDWGGQPNYPYSTPIETSVATMLGKYAAQNDIHFVLAVGDNFYTDGVRDVHDPRFNETFESVYTNPALNIPWNVLAGNHDHYGNASAQIEYTRYSKRWNFPDYYYDLEYTFDISGTTVTMQILMIDTVVMCGNSDKDYLGLQPPGPEDVDASEAEWAWIEHKLNTSKADFLLVAGHYPVYSIAEHGPTSQLVERLMPMLHRAKATGYISGHDHNLQYLEHREFGHTVGYFLVGAGNYIDPSEAHRDSVPNGSLKFHWADSYAFGGFAHGVMSKDWLTFYYVEASGKILYKASRPRRKMD